MLVIFVLTGRCCRHGNSDLCVVAVQQALHSVLVSLHDAPNDHLHVRLHVCARPAPVWPQPCDRH